MDNNLNLRKIDIWVEENRKLFKSEDLEIIKQKLYDEDPKVVESIMSVLKLYKPMTSFLFCLFLGAFGIHWFLIGNIGRGVLRIVLCCLVYLGNLIYPLIGIILDILSIVIQIYELIVIMSKAKKKNYEKIMAALG